MDISSFHFPDVWTFRTFILLMYGHFAHLDFIIDYDDARHPIYMCPHCGDDCLLPHIATCKYNPDTFKPASPRSAADAEQEDAAMEEIEEEPARE